MFPDGPPRKRAAAGAGGFRTSELTAEGAVIDHLQRDFVEGHEHAVATGSLRKSGEDYVLTWLGAYRLTYLHLWPLKHVRAARLRDKAERLLAELGV
jgi:hypothetical protein